MFSSCYEFDITFVFEFLMIKKHLPQQQNNFLKKNLKVDRE
jgi:hypothetical protein